MRTATILAAALCLGARGSAQAPAVVKTIKARDFMSMFGVNVHFNDNNYKNVQAVADALNILGFSRVRGSCVTESDVVAWKELAAKVLSTIRRWPTTIRFCENECS